MKIRHISIENFQPYFNKCEIDFSSGLNLIIGKGGKGKSKLFNAFYWVLFGKIYLTDIGWCLTASLPRSSNFTLKKHGFINERALYLAKEGEEVTTSVMMELEDDGGVIYQIERSVIAKRLSGDDYKSDSSWEVSPDTLKISYDSPTGTVVQNDLTANYKISQLFPEGIRNYIWFQGESLESLIDFRNKETLKAAVKHISYYPYYEKLSEIISISKTKIANIETKKLRDLNKQNAQIKEYTSIIDNKRGQIANEEKKKKALEDEITMISVGLEEGEKKLTGLANYNGLVSEYGSIKEAIAKKNAEMDKIDLFQRSQLPKLWILRGISSMVNSCKDIIEKHKEEELTLPEKKYLDNPSRSKLLEILKDGKCFVCGSDTREGTDAYNYIQERLKLQEQYLQEMEEYTNNMQFSKQFNMLIGRISDYPDSLLVSLEQIDKQWKQSEDEMEKLKAQRKQLLNRKEKIDEEIQEIKARHGVDPIQKADEVKTIATNIRCSRTLLERKQLQLNSIKETIATYTRELHKAETDLQNLGERDGSITKVAETEWKNISTFLDDVCKRVRENARKELLRKIEQKSNEFYVKFTEHDTGYNGQVVINDDYTIDFDPQLNTSHSDRKKMSIINAMLSLNQDAIGIYYPFISDAPTSSFDIETTQKYLMGIKDIFNQSIIITKDVEIGSKGYDELLSQSKIRSVFELETKLYADNDNPEKYEVSTVVNKLK